MSSEQSEQSDPTAEQFECSSTELEPVEVRLASHYYNSSTAAAGAAAAAALAATMATSSSRPSSTPSGIRNHSNSLQQNNNKSLERKTSADSALNLTNVEQREGAVVAIEVRQAVCTMASACSPKGGWGFTGQYAGFLITQTAQAVKQVMNLTMSS